MADDMIRGAARGPDGKAKANTADLEGNQGVFTAGSRIETVSDRTFTLTKNGSEDRWIIDVSKYDWFCIDIAPIGSDYKNVTLTVRQNHELGDGKYLRDTFGFCTRTSFTTGRIEVTSNEVGYGLSSIEGGSFRVMVTAGTGSVSNSIETRKKIQLIRRYQLTVPANSGIQFDYRVDRPLHPAPLNKHRFFIPKLLVEGGSSNAHDFGIRFIFEDTFGPLTNVQHRYNFTNEIRLGSDGEESTYMECLGDYVTIRLENNSAIEQKYNTEIWGVK